MKETSWAKFSSHFSPSFPASLLDVFAGNCQAALVDKSGMSIN
jgi:hypothetical protein